MDDIHGAASPGARKHFIKELAQLIKFNDGDGCDWGQSYEHLRDNERNKTSTKLRVP